MLRQPARNRPPNKKDPPAEVAAINTELTTFMQQLAPNGRRIGSAKAGIYAFFDYDGEPIYVGQTTEGLSGRISRHLTGRRSDAVAKFVLDPFEVLDVEVWPLWDLEALPTRPVNQRKAAVDPYEYTVYAKLVEESRFHAILNEGVIPPTELANLPQPYRARIIPEHLYEDRKHPDVRLARRAQTIASLARLISERSIDKPLRRVLQVQCERLLTLASTRFDDFAEEPDRAVTGDE